ncbi:MAG: tetratricopeptide repeat protein [Gallionellaceae bacterium]|jgi:predicted O-linked N-acetylglucosamine transferase (SPINDLY family)
MGSSKAALQQANQAVQTGLAHHQAGRIEQAYDAYQLALKHFPNHPDALHLLGMVAQQIGDLDLARELISLAIQHNPNVANFHSNLGNILHASGHYSDALISFENALKLEPKNALLHYNLAQALQSQGQLQAAADQYRQAILHAPKHVESLSNLGHTLQALGEVTQAIEYFSRAIFVAPQLAELHFNLANALKQNAQLDEAIASYQCALDSYPDYTHAHCNLGATLLAKSDYESAINCYRRALEINPELSDAHFNLGIALQAQDKLEEAVNSYRQALALNPNFAEAYCNLGNALRAQGKLVEAVACYEKALEIKPDYPNAFSNLLFLNGYHAHAAPDALLTQARQWELACVSPALRQQARHKIFARTPLAGRRLKIGYVSGDLRKHATSYFIEQIFAQHDRSRVEIFAYSNHRLRDAVTQRLHDLVEHWQVIAGMDDAAVCEQIAADEIDVLVDLSGHSSNNRMGVFARRAAPVQATYLYFTTTGLTEMDYWIGDEVLTPPEMDDQFSEQVWRLPRTWLAYKTLADAPETRWQPANDGTIWLGCFNNLGKITPQTVQLWAQLMTALPHAKLLLKNKELSDDGNCRRMLFEFAEQGILAERIELQPGSAWVDYMAQHDRLDIALDPVGGHGGGTSTCDALWMGVPVIHLLGDHVGARFAGSIINAIGHPEWIAHSAAEYIAKTIALANNVELRKQLRSTQRNTMAASPLCDAAGLASALEDSYGVMLQRWFDKSGEAK